MDEEDTQMDIARRVMSEDAEVLHRLGSEYEDMLRLWTQADPDDVLMAQFLATLEDDEANHTNLLDDGWDELLEGVE